MPNTGRISAASPNLSQIPPNPLDAFDPNTRPKHGWATYCPSRWNGGVFKLHAASGDALNALNYQGTGTLYTWDGSRWIEVIRFQPHEFRPERCDICHGTTLRDVMRWDRSVSPARQVPSGEKRNRANPVVARERGKGSKVLEPLRVLYLCSDCKHAQGYGY